MPEWNKTTARVLSRLRKVSLPTEQWQPTERDKAAIDRVWVFVGVEMEGYNKKENWNFVGAALPSNEQRELRKGVRERLLTVFDEEAFFADGKVANGVLDSFKRQHLLKWGDDLRADASASASAAEQSYVSTDEASTSADAAVAAAEARAAASETVPASQASSLWRAG